MKLSDLLSAQDIRLDVASQSKRQVLMDLSHSAQATTNIDAEDIYNALNDRERLGCTAVGNGVAIPHARLEQAQGCHLMFSRLDQAVDFDAEDEQKVDLVFCLIACKQSQDDPVVILSKLKRLASDPEIRQALRTAISAEDVLELINGIKPLPEAA